MKRVLGAILVFYGMTPAFSENSEQVWNGPYVGGGLTYSDAGTTVIGNRFTYNQNQAVNRVDHDYQGATLNGFAGWNWQRGDYVLGGEVSIGLSDLRSNLVFNTDNDIDQVQIDWSGTVVGRFGYSFGKSLIYAKAGLAVASIRNIGGDVNGGTLTLSDAHIREDFTFGATVGIGWEQFIADNWLVRIDASQTEFKAFSQVNQDGAPGSQFYRVKNGPISSLGVGLLYKF